jgi:hypothetical protein
MVKLILMRTEYGHSSSSQLQRNQVRRMDGKMQAKA